MPVQKHGEESKGAVNDGRSRNSQLNKAERRYLYNKYLEGNKIHNFGKEIMQTSNDELYANSWIESQKAVKIALTAMCYNYDNKLED